MKKFLNICYLFAVIALTACESSTSDGGDGSDSTATPPPTPMVLEEPDKLPEGTFGYFGLDIMALGDSVTWANLDVSVPVTDSLFTEKSADDEEEDFAWSVRILEMEKGRVFLEADFEENLYLNRIRIETPEYRHFATGLGVGSTVEELAKAYPDLVVQPFPEYQVIELIPNDHNIYHIPQPKGLKITPETELTVEDLNPAAQVSRVIVM